MARNGGGGGGRSGGGGRDGRSGGGRGGGGRWDRGKGGDGGDRRDDGARRSWPVDLSRDARRAAVDQREADRDRRALQRIAYRGAGAGREERCHRRHRRASEGLDAV